MVTLIDNRPGLALSGPPPMALRPGQERGRGARSNASGRFEREARSLADDGWETLAEAESCRTEVTVETARTIITRNDSPDISFDRSINPYRGCEHGCTYCYARPAHAYAGLSPGLDFETRIFAKPDAAARLRAELSSPHYKPRTIAIGANTDPYQPIEKTWRITRSILEVLLAFNHPAGIITKNALVLRDLDILKPMAERNLIKVALSVTSLDPHLSRSMEPRASAPHKRIEALRQLSAAGVPTVVMVAPIIPALNDSEIEAILAAAAGAGVREAGYVLLRLPREVRDIFREWLMTDQPGRAAHVLSLIRLMRGGKDYDATWGQRQRGTGPYAWTIARRFELAARRLGINSSRVSLDHGAFRRPPAPGEQLQLF